MDASSVWSIHQNRVRTLTDNAGASSRPDTTTTPTKENCTVNLRTLSHITECENLTPGGLPSPTKRLTIQPQTTPNWGTFSPTSISPESNSINLSGRKGLASAQPFRYSSNDDKNCSFNHQQTNRFDQLNPTILSASNSSGIGSLSSENSYLASGHFRLKGGGGDSYCSEGSNALCTWPEATGQGDNVQQSTSAFENRTELHSPAFIVDSANLGIGENKTLPKTVSVPSVCQNARSNCSGSSDKATEANHLEDSMISYYLNENNLCEKEKNKHLPVTAPCIIGEQVLDENLESVARYVDELTTGRMDRKTVLNNMVHCQSNAPRLSSSMRDSLVEQSLLRRQEDRRQHHQEMQKRQQEQTLQMSKLYQLTQQITAGLAGSINEEKGDQMDSQIQQMLIRILENQPLDSRFASNIGNVRSNTGELWNAGDASLAGTVNNIENPVARSSGLQSTPYQANSVNINSFEDYRRQMDSRGHETINQLPLYMRGVPNVPTEELNGSNATTAANNLINLISQLSAHAVTQQSLAEATGLHGSPVNNTVNLPLSSLIDLGTSTTSSPYQLDVTERQRTASTATSLLNNLDSLEGGLSSGDQLAKTIAQLDGTQQLSEELRQLSVPYQQILANCESDIERAATVYRNSASAIAQKSEAAYHWSGRLPVRRYHCMTFSRKVFLGGVPWDSTSDDLILSFSRFGNVTVSWPQKDGNICPQTCRNPSPKGYCYLIFEHESSVADLVAACIRDPSSGGDYYKISSSKYRSKDVQVIPWVITDSQFIKSGQFRPDSKRTVFVGALHGMITAEALVNIMNDLFGNVVFAALDTDKFKYPIGSGRVTFSSHKSYMRAVTANFVDVRTAKFSKTLQIDPYLEDSLCNNCFTSPGIYFCRSFECFRYFCPSCWQLWHNSAETRQAHKPLRRTIRPVQDRLWMMSRQ